MTTSTSIFSTLPVFLSSFIKCIRESRFPPSTELNTILRVDDAPPLEVFPDIHYYLLSQ